MNDVTERLIRRIEAAWADLTGSYAGLSDAQLTQPGVAGTWSVKDVLAHVSTWEEEALKHLPTIIEGGRPPLYSRQGGIDAFNARMAEQQSDLPLAAVLEHLHQTHRRLIAFIRATPRENLSSGRRLQRRLKLDTYGHYKIHSEGIRRWRNAMVNRDG